MPTTESRADLDIQVRAHVLANPALYEKAGRDIDTTYSPEAFWEQDERERKAANAPPGMTLELWRSAANRAPLIVSRMLEHHRYDRGIPPADESAMVVLLHWVLTDQACNSAPVKLTAFQDWSIASIEHDLARAYAYDIADNAEWREYVRKALAVMRETKDRKPDPADQAYGAAASFIEWLAVLANGARQRDPRNPVDWKGLGSVYAPAFISWHDLTHLLTPVVRDAARRVYPPSAPAVKLGRLPAKPSLIEAITDELGVFFRNVVYQDRRCPLDPETERVAEQAKAQATARQVAQGKPATPFGWGDDYKELMKLETRAAVRARIGVKNLGDGWMLMAREWENQDPERIGSRLERLRCESIDFDELKAQLNREAAAVLASGKGEPAPAVSSDLLARLEAGIAAATQFTEAQAQRMERVAAAIESVGPRADGVNGEASKSAMDDLPMLSPKASAVYELLLQLPEHRGMTGPQIVDALPMEASMDESTLRKSIVPALEPYGLEHVAKVGYRIKPSKRPPSKVSD